MYQLILASESPRRKQLLSEAGFQFEIHPSYVSEFLEKNLTVKEQILSLARRKSSSVFTQLRQQRTEPFAVLGSDTMVVIDNTPLGKPESPEQAFEFLKLMSGRTHDVVTAVCLIESVHGHELSHIDTTRVTFKKLSDSEIKSYIETGEPLDKAGAYAIQGGGGKFVESIDGSMDTVVGLPVKTVKRLWSQLNSTIFLNYVQIAEEVHKLSNGRCQVLPVSKLQPVEKIRALASCGVIHFAENYVQESLQKIAEIKNPNLRWHLIGHLQKNKVKALQNNFYLIHSVDSFELAQLIHSKCNLNSRQKVLLQINLAQEDSKEGFSPDEFKTLWPEILRLNHLEVCGLMTMPPLANVAEQNRLHFRHLREILTELQSHVNLEMHPLNQLSMGTTSDYRVAIEEGSTWVRLGTILFGERPSKG